MPLTLPRFGNSGNVEMTRFGGQQPSGLLSRFDNSQNVEMTATRPWLEFIRHHKDSLLDLVWETSDFRTRKTTRPSLPALRIAESGETVEKYLDALVIFPAVGAAHGDPTEARQRVREALRLFCNGGKAPGGKATAGKHVSGFGNNVRPTDATS